MNEPHTESSEIVPCAVPTHKKFQYLCGAKFGRLLVYNFAGKKTYGSCGAVYYWDCLCDCGKTIILHTYDLRSGLRTSCGCSNNTDQPSKRRKEYRRWKNMLSRCNNPQNSQWEDYGGRGITVCERWMVFENFLEDMGPPPTPRHTLDRCNNNGNYEPNNCRWATYLEQGRNTRRNTTFTINGKTRCMSEWSEITGLSVHTIRSRLDLGWDITMAITTPATTPLFGKAQQMHKKQKYE